MHKAVIATKFPSVERTARALGVGPTRVRALAKLVDDIVAGRDSRSGKFTVVTRRVRPRQAAKTRSSKRVVVRHRSAR